MKKRLALITIFCVMAILFASHAIGETKKAAPGMKEPIITLVSFEVPQYDEFWFYAATVTPTKGKAGNHGAPLPMSFLFSIYNPNPFPVLLEGITYTITFGTEFDMMTSNVSDQMWIPEGKTNQVRVTTMISVAQAQGNLALTGGAKLKEKGLDIWNVLESYWVGIPNLQYPVAVRGCTFSFSAKGATKAVAFEQNIY